MKNFLSDISQAQHPYCAYLQMQIDDGNCIDLQMIGGGFLRPDVLPDIHIDLEALNQSCKHCKYCL